jgi:hypothetical protein
VTAPAQQRLTVDPATVRVWLGHLYAGHPGLISICSDADGWVGRRFTADDTGLDAATSYTTALDRRRPTGIYAQVTTLREHPAEGQRGGEDLAHALTHLWADGDFGTIGHKPGPDDLPAPPDMDAVAKVVAESGLPAPSGWTLSGGGYNPVWMLADRRVIGDDEDRARVKDITTGWQAILAAQAYVLGWSWDSEVGNLDRLMKLPGTINRKEGLERPTSIGFGVGVLYDFTDLADIAAQLAPAAREAVAQAASEKQARKAQRLGRPAPAPRPPRRERPMQRSGAGPLDVLADMLDFRDVLEPAGFTYQGQHSDGREKWLRPTANGDRPSSAYSLLCDDHVAVNWSERSDLPVGPQAPGSKLTIGTLWAHLNYGGNTSEAARDIMRAAGGHPVSGAATRLPAAVLAEVRTRCLTESRHGFEDLLPPTDAAPPVDWSDLSDEAEPGPATETEGPPADRIPPDFWSATPPLSQIHQNSRARRGSPDAVCHAVLARVGAMASPTLRVDSGIHRPATLGWYCGLFGPSGSGKGNAEDTAEELTPFPMDVDLAYIDISTGQGLIAAYLDFEPDPDDDKGKKKVLVQTKTRGYALATEGSVLDAMSQMSAAATLNGVLCKAWMSERQGTSNANVDLRRALPKGSYTLSMSLGVQEEPAAKLLEMGSIGLPQRLAWAHARISPDTPKERPATTGPVMVTTRDGKDITVTRWVASLHNTVMSVPPHVTEELDELAMQISLGRGEEFPLDTHEPLWRLKCAALLALLHGRLAVTAEDWSMAETMWLTSRRVRDSVQEAARRRTQAELARLRAEAVKTAVESQAAVYETVHGVHPTVVNVAKRAHRHLIRRGEETSARDVNRATVKKADRDRYRSSGEEGSLWAAAVQYGSERGWLIALADGALLAAGSVSPEDS